MMRARARATGFRAFVLLAVAATATAGCGGAENTAGVAESEVNDATTVAETAEAPAGEDDTAQADEAAGYEDGTATSTAPEGDTGGYTDPELVAENGGAVDLSAPVRVAGQIDVGLDFHSYTFEGQEGQQVSVSIDAINGTCSESDGWNLQVNLLDSAGDELGDTGRAYIAGCNAYGPWTLPASGQHTIKIGGNDGSGNELPLTGSYEATLATLTLDETPIDPASGPVQVNGDIDIALDADLYIIDGDEGQQVSVTVDAINGTCSESDEWNLQINLLDSAGDELGDTGRAYIAGCNAFGPWTLPAAGAHAVKIGATDRGGNNLPLRGSYQATIAFIGG